MANGELILNGKKKRGVFVFNGWTKYIAIITFLSVAIWRAGAWSAGIGAAIQQDKQHDIKQDSCITEIQKTNEKILYLLTVQQIKDSLQSPRTLEQAKMVADSQAIVNTRNGR